MKTYKVFAHEDWIQTYEVKANSEEEARLKVARGQGTAIDNQLEFCDMGDENLWNVECENEDE